MKLADKVAIVTGGGTGIGRAIAERFVAEGAYVCLVGRRADKLAEVASALPPAQVTTCPGDVSDPAAVARVVEAALGFGKGIQVLVNNAGMDQPPCPVGELDLATWQQVLAVNLTGPFLMIKAVIPHMLEGGYGSIINISSLAGLLGVPGLPAYCASKGGLISLTKQVAVDYGPHNIRCNCVCPGATRTEMMVGAMSSFAESCGITVEEVLATFSRDIPLRRISDPKEMAGICCFLASDDASFVNAAVIPVDGGACVVDVSGAAINQLAALHQKA
ncbi:MAG: SDR family oxidoreductase [Thermoleophilia bacterium]|nr:SDR family oxidoreductase [Thermoleophilia bacterium]